MKAFVSSFGLVFLFSVVTAAGLEKTSLAEIFAQGREPSLAQGKIKWKCVHDTNADESDINCASNYGFQSDGQNFKAPDFGITENGRIAFEKKNNALVFTQRDKEGTTSHLAVRSLVTSAGPRLVMEESTTLPSWQKPGEKSSITGFTPHVYVICAPEEEFNSFITGKPTSSNSSKPAKPARIRQ